MKILNTRTRTARKRNWEEYFEDQENYLQTHDNKKIYDNTGNTNYYVLNCLFIKCKISGAIYFETSNNICTLVENSVFRKCSSTSYGGSVYFYCPNSGQFVQQQVCYCESIAKFGHQAFSQSVKKISSHKNYAKQVTVSSCGLNETTGFATIHISNGDILISNCNITKNKCQRLSSMNLNVHGSQGICRYSEFRENNQFYESTISHQSLRIYTPKDITNFAYCNIIGNIAGYDDVIFWCEGTTNVEFSNFMNNFAICLLQEHYRKDISLTVTNSFIYHQNIITRGNVTITNLISESNNNYFPFFYTDNCFFDPKITQSNDVYGILHSKYLRR